MGGSRDTLFITFLKRRSTLIMIAVGFTVVIVEGIEHLYLGESLFDSHFLIESLIFGVGVPPSATPSPTPLPSPTPTPGAGSGMHVGDLDGSVKTGGAYWAARVTLAVHNGSEAPLSGVLVSGTWGGSYGSGACTTGDAGRCTISLFSLPADLTSITFTVTGLSLSGQTYTPSANHDPDGDSDGTAIVISR